MGTEPVQFIVAAFEDDNEAEKVLAALKEIEKENAIGLEAAVAMRKDLHGGIRYTDAGLTPAKGALGGVVLGAIVGILTGGAGLVISGLGGVIGGLVGKRKRDSRFSSGEINKIVAALPPGSSAVLAVIMQADAPALEHVLEQMGGDVLSAEITADLVSQLEQHRDAAQAALEGTLEPPSI
jgi:uncharacterized membrane protein